MLIVSFDAVGDSEFERLVKYPTVLAFSKQSAVFRNISSIFLSNTYPVHVSVATGVTPDVHGVISNTEPFPFLHPVWNIREAGIRVKTLWQAAAEKGINTAAVLWPVTAFSKTIRYNIPEALARPGKSQLMTSLHAGSKFLQLKMFLRHRKLLNGINQPDLDNFSTACMADILREYNPGLALIHLTAYDTLCHQHGKGSDAINKAFESLDKNLAILLEAAGNSRDIIIFSDHSQINVHTILTPNSVLADMGLLHKSGGSYIPGDSGCYIECCGGSAFFRAGQLSSHRVDELRESVRQSEGFRRFLTHQEMLESGQKDAAFGFCAKAGYCYEAYSSKEKANHGYPLDMPDYTVFYMARGFDLEPGDATQGGSLLDIAPLVAKRLGLNLLNSNMG